MDNYKGYKLLDKIMLVCRDLPSRTDGYGINCGAVEYQAYLVDPSSETQLKSARDWASWTECGPAYKNEEGKWTCDWEIDHKPAEFTFENDGFTLELLDCAGGSSQGGKLSFWNCLVKKDAKTFKIGINSEMLLNLLKDADFTKGVCQSPLIFITQKGRVGLTVKDSETYRQCISDRNLKKKFNSETTSKFAFGDLLKTATLKEVYLGTITQYYALDIGKNADRYNYSTRFCLHDLNECTIVKLAKPITYHIFESVSGEDKKLSEFTDSYKKYQYVYPQLKKTCPKRVIDGKIDLDITEKKFYNALMDKAYNFELYKKLYIDSCRSCGRNSSDIDEDVVLFYFLGSRIFGFGKEPFELPQALMDKLKAAGVKYIEE